MKFFLGGLGNWDADYKHIKQIILEADKLGFDGALMPDHYMWGTMDGRINRPDRFVTFETWMTISYLLAKTEQIKLGTLVTPIPFRPPAMMAKMVATIDNLSNGRVIFGVGAGWAQEEFDGFSVWDSNKVRVDKTKEGLELMLKLWTEDEVSFEGAYYTAKNAVVEPKPVQKPYPPLLFGGVGNRMLNLAGRYGDIVFVPTWGGLEKAAEGRQRVLDSARKYNRADKIGFMSGTMMGPPVTEINSFMKAIEAAQENGDKYFLPSFGRDENTMNLLRQFSKEVMPSFM
ncbi:MAG: Alkanesulfonate monooxygenase [Candidatus Heimdallarchaeota archaeon LC_2]|nr:MAG: Alkanesulfonate monooxygenase [Candidatus Heimdallarchaeota archaeon LC_2]